MTDESEGTMTCDNIYCNQGRNCTCTGLNQRNSDGSDPDLPVTMYETFSWLQSLFAALVLCAVAGVAGLCVGIIAGVWK